MVKKIVLKKIYPNFRFFFQHNNFGIIKHQDLRLVINEYICVNLVINYITENS